MLYGMMLYRVKLGAQFISMRNWIEQLCRETDIDISSTAHAQIQIIIFAAPTADHLVISANCKKNIGTTNHGAPHRHFSRLSTINSVGLARLLQPQGEFGPDTNIGIDETQPGRSRGGGTDVARA